MKRIIFINGPLGIGKSALANELSNLLGHTTECIDPDFYYNSSIGTFLLYGWPLQVNRFFITYFRGIVEERLQYKELIIPISITTEICKKEFLDYFREKTKVIHIVLETDEHTLLQRINCDSKRDKRYSIETIESNRRFINKNFEKDIHIDTTNKSVFEIVNIIMEQYL